MNTTIIDITPAADYMDENGWAQGTMKSVGGRVCLTGALKYCDMRPGDWLLALGVFRHLDRAEDWNDTRGRTKAEVLEVLRTTTITDELMQATYGPRWRMIVKLVRRIAVMTDTELAAARAAAWETELAAARAAARAAAWDTELAAAWDTELDAAWAAAWDAAWAAAWGVVVRDLITPEQFDTLTAPIRAAFGQDFFDNEQEDPS